LFLVLAVFAISNLDWESRVRGLKITNCKDTNMSTLFNKL
jgi:hypothetical protein